MSRTVVDDLREGLSGFPATERRVAHHLLADYPIAGLQSATELARAVGVSTPTVLRLVARLGFGAYPDFQRRLREELAAQLSSPLAKLGAAAGSAGQGWLQGFAQVVAGNIDETFAHLPVGEFEQVCRLLADRRLHIHLLGGRFTDALARYVAVQLRILRPAVNHLRDQEANWQDQLLDIGRRDLLLVFDIRRYQPSLLKLAQTAVARGARVILLTDQWLSPIARLASHVIPARVAVPSAWDSSAALMALGEALLAGVTRLDWDYSQARMRELEKLRE